MVFNDGIYRRIICYSFLRECFKFQYIIERIPITLLHWLPRIPKQTEFKQTNVSETTVRHTKRSNDQLLFPSKRRRKNEENKRKDHLSRTHP